MAEGILLPDDVAWHEGLDSWVPLGEFVATAGEPQPPEAIPAPPQPQEEIPAVIQPRQPAEPVSPQPITAAPKAKSKKLLVVGIMVGLLVLGGAGVASWILFFKEKPQENAKVEGGKNLPDNTKPPKGTNNSNPLPPNPSTLIPGLPGVDTNAVPTKPEPTNPEPSLPAKKPGTVLRKFKTGSPVSSPATGPDGTVYVGSHDEKLYAINGKSGVKLWEFETGGIVESSPAIGSDGTVYVGSVDKKLYAIKTDSKGLAKSPWPMSGQNAQHTGRAPAK